MKRNKLLNIANWVCRFGKVVFIITSIAATFFVIHWNINSGFYENFELEQTGMDLQFKVITANSDVPKEAVNVADIPGPIIIFNYLKLVAILTLAFFILREIQQIVLSIREVSAFRERNIISFQLIGQLMVVVFFVDMVSIWGNGIHDSVHIEFNFSILLGALAAFILAEVFREGNHLLEENKLTI